MPKAPRATDSTTKKRNRKNNLEETSAAPAVAQSAVESPAPAPEVPAVHLVAAVSDAAPVAPRASLEEQIRARAYELYLKRNGNGGSPEQDWLQAKQEICGRQQVA